MHTMMPKATYEYCEESEKPSSLHQEILVVYVVVCG